MHPKTLPSTILSSLALITALSGASVARADALVVEANTAYAVSSDSADSATADRLYRINLLSGESTSIGALGPVAFEDVEGLAVDASGTLFGVDDDTKTLLSISTTTGRASAIGGLGSSRIATGVAQDLSIAFACNGQLYAAARTSKNFYRVNTQTGGFELAGAAGALNANIQDMSFVAGSMFGLGDTGLYRIDLATGSTTLIGAYGPGINFNDGGGLAADSNGQLWAIGERRDSRGILQPSQIYRIDAQSGAATLSASSPIGGFESLAIAPPVCSLGAPVVTTIPTLNHAGLMLLTLAMLMFGARRWLNQ
jgi:hypothetical protein